MSIDERRDIATLLVALLLLPFIVHMLHAPRTATIIVACVCWPIVWASVVALIIEGSKRHD